jgi:Na+/H+ antiporter NhaD/arsenite permease-like protein
LAIPQVVAAWLMCISVLLAVFYVLDRRNRRAHPPDAKHRARDRIELEGSHNLIFLAAIVALVLAQKAEWLQGIARWPAFAAWGAALGWDAAKAAESATTIMVAGLMVATAAIAHRYANRDALRENEFGFGPVREVGFLFAGIFATMVPALDLLEAHAQGIGLVTARQYFWGSGALSSMLDNAPTYLSFLTAAFGLHHLSLENPLHVQSFLAGAQTWKYVVAVSLGSVFFGANTYIGNGPNFMVKSIAEAHGVRCPSFFAYILRFSLPILLPLFAVVSWLILS